MFLSFLSFFLFLFCISLICLLIYFLYLYIQNVYILHIVTDDFRSGFLSYFSQVPTFIWQYQHTIAALAVSYSGTHLLPRLIWWQDISLCKCNRIKTDCSGYLNEQAWKLTHFWRYCGRRYLLIHTYIYIYIYIYIINKGHVSGEPECTTLISEPFIFISILVTTFLMFVLLYCHSCISSPLWLLHFTDQPTSQPTKQQTKLSNNYLNTYIWLSPNWATNRQLTNYFYFMESEVSFHVDKIPPLIPNWAR